MQPLATEAALFEVAAAFLDMNGFVTNNLPLNSVKVSNTGEFPRLEMIDVSASNSVPTQAFAVDNDIHSRGQQSENLRREQEAFRRRKQRQRRKDEREVLKREAYTLTLQLQRLKQAIESNAGTDRASIQLSNYYWRDCAARQQQQRVSAETEQKRLVAATNAQATYIDNLTRLFQRTGTKQQGRCFFDGEISDDTVFKALLQEVDDSYTHANKLFQECNMDELPIGITNSSHGRTSDGEVEYLQHVNKGMQPFDYYDTYSFSWKVATHPHRQHDREVYEGAVGLRDTIAIKFRLERTLTTGSKVSVLQRLVNRRYFEQNQVIHVWKIYSEGEGFLRGMNSIETGWCRFRPTSDGFGTWTEVVVRQVPVFLNTVRRSGSIVGEFRQLLEDKVDEDEEALRSAVEGMLLEDTLAILDE